MVEFKILTGNLRGKTEGKYDRPQSEYSVFLRRFDPGTLRLRRSASRNPLKGVSFLVFRMARGTRAVQFSVRNVKTGDEGNMRHELFRDPGRSNKIIH
jgi:hypothetical protein